MKRLLSVMIILYLLAPAVLVADNKDKLREIKTTLWPKAYRTQDVELLGSILHESFELIDNDGNITTREDELKYIRENKWDPKGFVFLIDRLEIYDDAFAIVSGTGKSDTYTYKSSNYFIQENGVWKAVSSHVSGFRKLE